MCVKTNLKLIIQVPYLKAEYGKELYCQGRLQPCVLLLLGDS